MSEEIKALPSFGEAVRVWLRIGCLSFGGPAGQIALLHREVVDDRRWISDKRFLHALNFCTLLPGPEAQQLATYLGWLMHGARGGLAAGALWWRRRRGHRWRWRWLALRARWRRLG